ncbi:oxidoreductase [Pleurocapsa sp. FMAR1]|uniref:oxidoreductase n=1 Tax=Pleurocapsa sp. FMAR1 TaxID=3040204 RepID=UPI0029C8DEE0|nr:oxidoreductase [Pleurocapsa sp. FMAR1]
MSNAKSESKKIWLITGVSRGLGKALAQAVLDQGDIVIGTTRSGKADIKGDSDQLKILGLELTDTAQISQTVEAAYQLHGRLDVIVNNAGYGLLGAIEESSDEEMKHLFDVNFFGVVQLIKAALPRLRQQRSGHIINISSIAGLAPMAGSGLYAAAKFAVEGVSQSLAQEVEPLGIKVTLVEPGAFRTDFLSDRSISNSPAKIADYLPTSGEALQHLADITGKQLGDPTLGAQAIIKVVEADNPPLHLVMGSDALERTRANIQSLTGILNDWQEVSKSTDFREMS